LGMSALGRERTFRHVRMMSATPPKADIVRRDSHVCYGPIGDLVAQIGSAGDPPAVVGNTNAVIDARKC
jgi:hypothetical protein